MSSIQDRLNAMRSGRAAVQPGYNDGTAILYLRDLYDQQTAADQEALKSTYKQNVADVKASGGSTAASTSPQSQSIQERLAKMRTSGQSSAKKTTPITTDLSGEAWTRATPSQTRVPASTASQQVDVSRLQEQRRQAQVDMDTDTVASIDRQLSQMRSGEDAGFSSELTGMDRVAKTVTGGVKDSAAGYTDLLGLMLQSLGKSNTGIRNYQNQGDIDSANQAISRYQEMLKTASTAAERDRLETLIRANQAKLRAMDVQTESEENISRKSAENLYQKADALKESSERDIAEAKQGLGSVGQFAVDLGAAGTQLAGDIALSSLTGGSSLIAVGARSAGSAAQAARQSGASFGQQVAYGIGSGALSVATEKLSNVAAPFKKAFGSGVLDEAIEKAAGKLMQNAAGKALLSAAGEGFEEIAEDAIQPILQRITYDKDALAQYKDPDYLANTLYDGLIGAAMGGIGGTAEAVGSRVRGNRQNGTLNAAGTRPADTEGNFTSESQSGTEGVSEIRVQQKASYQAETEVNENGLDALTQQERVNLSSGKKNRVISTFQDAVSFVRTALSNKQNVDRAYLGKIPDSVAQVVQQNTGLDIRGFGVMMNGNDVRHIIKDHGDALMEQSRGQVAVTADDIARIPEVLSSPDRVYLSEEADSKGRNALVFEKQIGERYISIQGVSDGKHLLQTDTLYIRKGRTRMTRDTMPGTDRAVPVINAQSEPSQSSSYIDSTIAQGADSVNPQTAKTDILSELLFGGKRVDQSSLTPEQFDAAIQANEQGTVGMDAAGKVYQVDPEQHIDRRTADSVGSRNMNAFQFDHPELHGYYQMAANSLIADADLSQQFPMVRRFERTMQGNKTIQGAQASEQLRMAMDETGLSRAELIDAAQRIINDQGQENVKAAKQVEVILDSMLTNGWTTMTGETVAPNEAYIRDKSRIAGSQPQVESREPLPIWDMEEPANDGLGNDGVGARTSQFPRKERVSQAKSVYQQSDNATDADKAYDATSDAERLTSARERLQVDYDGEKQYLKDAPEWSGEDYAVAKLIQSDLRQQAVESGDFTEFRAWSRDVQKHASFFGQDLQSLKMWVEQSADKAVSDAAGVLDAAKEAEDAAPVKARKKITDDVINDALGAIAEFGTRAETLSNAGDMTGLYDLAVELANYRGYQPSKIIRKALKSCSQEQLTDVVWSEISGISIDAIPSSAGQYISTYQYLSHLLNAKTILRNITSNTVFSPIESLFTNNIAAIVDRLSASVVGKYQGITAQQARTVGFEKGPFSKAGWKGGLEGAKQSSIDVALDISRGNSQNKYEAGTNRTFNRHKVKDPLLNLMLNTGNNLEGILGYGLNTTDEFQKGGTEAKVRESMRGILGTEGTRVTPEMADQFVENEQLYRSFQRETAVGYLLQASKDYLNIIGLGTSNGKTAQLGKYRFAVKDFGLGDFLSKYTRVPGALVTTLTEYTDLGFAKAIYNLGAMAYTNSQVKKGRGDADVGVHYGAYSGMTNAEAAVYSQRAFAQNIGRVLTGKGLMMACSTLAKMGVLIFTDDDDKDEATIKNAQGLSGLQINLSGMERLLDGKDAALQEGDILLSADSLEPVNGLMEGGARMADLEDDAGYGQKMNVIAETVINSFTDLSMMQNVKSVQNAVTYKSDDETWGDVAKEAAYGVAKNSITGFIPGPMRQAANWSDPYYRDTSSDSPLETIGNSVKSAVPGLRQQLPERITPLGEKREKTTSGGLDFFTSFVSPFNVARYQQSDVVDAMDDAGVYAKRSAPNKLTANGKTVEMTADQKRQYQMNSGTMLFLTVSDMLGNSGYKMAGDAQREDLMKDARSYASDVAKAKVMGNSSVDKWVQKTMEAQRRTQLSPATVIVYRDKLSRLKDMANSSAANDAVREAIRRDSSLTAEQKNALDDIVVSDGFYVSNNRDVDYTSDETFIISQMSDGAQRRYSGIKNQFGLDAETYSKAWAIYQNDDLKADQKRQQLSALGYNGSALYKALGQKLG